MQIVTMSVIPVRMCPLLYEKARLLLRTDRREDRPVSVRGKSLVDF